MEIEGSKSVPKPAQRIGTRHIQYLLFITLIIVGYGMRVSFNVAIIAMLSEKKNESYPTYPEWSGEKQFLLSGFFWGYICFQLIAGQLGKKFGAKYPLMVALFACSLLTIAMPFLCAQFGYRGALVCRILQGLTQGFLFPSLQTLLSVWAPLSERTKYGSIVWAGTPIGNVIGMPIAGAISASSVGWPVTFYFYGGMGLFWCILWWIFGDSSPSTSSWISEEEKRWIEYELGENQSREEIATPWKAIFTSAPFYALLVTHCGQAWGFWTLLTEIPSYMSSVLKFDIKSNGLLSTLPYFVMFIVNLIMSQIAEQLIEKRKLTLEVCRKLFNSIGMLVPALSLISLCFVGTTSKDLVIFFLVLAVSSNAAVHCGMILNHIDMAPVHAGTIMAITNSIASILAILAPLAVGAIESITGYKETDEALWNIVFYLTAGIFVGAGSVFVFFGSTDVQPWNLALTKDKKLSIISTVSIEIQKRRSSIYQIE